MPDRIRFGWACDCVLGISAANVLFMDNDMFLVYCAAAVGVSLVVHKLIPIALVSLLKIFPDGGNSKLEVLWGDIGERKEATEKYKNDVDKI